MEKLTFTMVKESDLKKSDKRALSTLYLYWLENNRADAFDLPLFIDDNGKGVMSVESFKRVFYAFQIKTGIGFNAQIKSGSDGDESKYNVVHVYKCAISFDSADDTVFFNDSQYVEPKKADVKRESSKKTEEKNNAKKEEAKKEADKLNEKFATERTKKILDVVQGYGLKCTPQKLALLEAEIIKILKA